jgi:FAD/FMN-containing dehydrogenase
VMQNFESWGRYPRADQTVLEIFWSNDFPLREHRDSSQLPVGMGRSYGDVCLNSGNVLLSTRGMDRLLSFDEASGVIRCEGGVTLAAILDFAVPRGWFLPVTPGTKFVTVGGAIANDVHGKNHHVAGTVGRITLALDFPIRAERSFQLVDRLGELTLAAKGRIYPAKDARMTAKQFQVSYPNFQEFSRFIDPRFSSSFWRRVACG